MRIDYERLSRVDLNLLVAFDVLWSEQSVTRAAKRLRLGQPAMSHALARLREIFEDELFTRTTDGIRPTPRAAQLAPNVRALLERLQTTLATPCEFDPMRDERTFRIGTNEGQESLFLPALAALAHEHARAVNFDLRPVAPDEATARIDAGELDLVLGTFAEGRAHHKQRVLCANGGYHALFDPRFFPDGLGSMDAYAAAAHVRVASQEAVEDVIDRRMTDGGVVRRVAIRTAHPLAAALVVRAAPLVVTLGERVAVTMAAAHGLKTEPAPFSLGRVPVVMMWHASFDREPSIVWLRDTVAQAARNALLEALPEGPVRSLVENTRPRLELVPPGKRPRTETTTASGLRARRVD
ncbi:Transcriptional regulator, LysR family [Labilithrix luteola]|uniref:Transcriptional regulator, LysR family n=1 Tax=Labilithrix luteola TaxID=1391654 RepID=A0A0K1PYX1_9BACT|nr:LysR family transcriptional regulator [Labilithrix luteola]AKU98601.1 Transcriptional regulator, LysR family [Labilithrix luteola]